MSDAPDPGPSPEELDAERDVLLCGRCDRPAREHRGGYYPDTGWAHRFVEGRVVRKGGES